LATVVEEDVSVEIMEGVVFDRDVVTFITRIGVVPLEQCLSVYTRTTDTTVVVYDVVFKVDGFDDGALRGLYLQQASAAGFT